jgi:type I restriction enzyme S subunit
MEVKKGYKQTEVGVIPEDWQELSVSDVTTKVGSGITPTGGDANYKKHGRPFVRSQNVGWGKLLLDDLAFIDDKLHSTFSSSETCEGDVLLNITGASIGRSAVVDMAVAKGNVNQHVCILRPDQQRCNSKFLNGLLLSPIGQKQIDSFQAGGNRQGLNFSQIRAIRIPLPPTLAEQEAIAGALSDADAWIESLEQLIAKKRQIKQGAMQELLTGKRRLPGFSGKWETKRLGDIGSCYRGVSYNPAADLSSCDTKSTTRLLRSNNVQDSAIVFEDMQFVASSRVSSEQYLQENDILICMANGSRDLVGKAGRFKNPKDAGYTFGAFMGVFRPSIELAHPVFAFYLFRTQAYRQHIAILLAGSSINNLTPDNLEPHLISVPRTVTEQTAIATVLSDMDTEIEALESKLAKAREVKQGMMQELLTGRIRLV